MRSLARLKRISYMHINGVLATLRLLGSRQNWLRLRARRLHRDWRDAIALRARCGVFCGAPAGSFYPVLRTN